ncbi:Tyrosinase ustQ [Colletotrichum gloeosporioides]|uniref:Tyrosinase ustQ n=1 Tax=Colletotrichum gloeosporioides TaxID=474922 RepID=A0A8H4CL90_COLGL|nr:Tyrosinase ustQ [Colletotrichum gloeosporioides]KAF3805959.1 Tyrosinase ustQ [Colletotrichum gloeosporioides]
MKISLAQFAIFGLLAVSSAAAGPLAKRNGTYTQNQRKSWNALTDCEKTSYIEAELCLMSRPPRAGVAGAQNLWDELHYTHIYQGNYIHYVGHFLPWHRYFVRAHEMLLQTECNYTSAHPYWDELTDLETAPLNQSSIFDPVYGFGGDGQGEDGCIADGLFTNLTLHMKTASSNNTYCLQRKLNQGDLDTASSDNLVKCFNKTSYDEAWQCYNGSPHGAGHGAVGGLMSDPIESNGDPLFYLHHAYLDRVWWQWQEANLTARLTDISGQNTPDQSILDMASLSAPGSELTDYNGDNGNVTTLDHVLFIQNLVPNVTIADIMDIRGDVICAECVN